jgi:hypothetical protein
MLLQQDVILLTESFRHNPVVDLNLYTTLFHIPYSLFLMEVKKEWDFATNLHITNSLEQQCSLSIKKKGFGIDNMEMIA